MDSARINALLEEASEQYNEASYDKAIELWKEALSLDPGNTRASEGIRMATLLAETERAAAPPETEDRIGAGIARVQELLQAGKVDEAREGYELLEELAPGHPAVSSLEAEIEQAALRSRTQAGEGQSQTASVDLEKLLQQARTALAQGRELDAARAAHRILQFDPGNMEACGILSMTSPPAAIGGPPEAAATRAAAPAPSESPTARSTVDEGGPAARIDALLTEGQAAFDEGRLQDAIAIWSRIFAIDHSHAEAGQRIDAAKAALEEQTREIDELFYRAVDAQEAGKLVEAFELFQKVLQLSPTHIDAQSRLKELNDTMEGRSSSIPIDSGIAEEIARRREPEISRNQAAPEPIKIVPLLPVPERRPRAVEARADAASVALAQARLTKGGRPLLFVGGALIFLAVGGGVYFYLGTISGSMQEAQATVVAPRPDPTGPPAPSPAPTPASAASPASGGAVPGAAVPLASAPVQQAPPAPVAGSSEPADFHVALARARQHYREERWAESVLGFREAMRLNPVEFNAQDQLEHAMRELETQARLEGELTESVKLFAEADYATALHKFYRIQQDYPNLRYIERWIRDSWYNWGVSLLRSGAAGEAEEKFSEVLEIDPGDSVSSKAREVARRYKGRQSDSVLASYASSLPLRTLESRR